MSEQKYKTELQQLETALQQITEMVSELRVNPIKLKAGSSQAAAWQIEDADRNRMYVVVSAAGAADDSGEDSGESDDESETEVAETEDESSDLVFTVEAEVGQFVELEAKDAKIFLELNYSGLTLSKLAVTPDLRLVVLHRRWFEAITSDDVASAIAEVWNVAENLRSSLKPVTPGHA